MTLVLLGQTEMAKASRGMLVAFIDFAKAYDKVDRGKLWGLLERLGINGRFLRFLKALYEDSSCRVKVHDKLSDKFGINSGLRQGCVLSPLLFSLYINGVVARLHAGNCGVQCGGDKLPGLLFADDTSLVAQDEGDLKKSLDILVHWCQEWGVKINVGKSGIMHMRKKVVERCEVEYKVDGEVIPMVSSYKYLGCVVDEHLEFREMVEEKAAAGRRALGAWLNKCRVEVGNVEIGTFKKLMSALVDSTMLYGAEIWGCTSSAETINQVQLHAFRMFFGVGTLHPKTSLMMEMGLLPVAWEARVRCVQFWYKILMSKVYEGRLLRKVALRAVEWRKGCWIRSIAKCVGKFGWQDVSGGMIRELSQSEVNDMLLSVAWRNVKEEWKKEMHEKPKLSMMELIAECGVESSCAVLKLKAERRMMLKLRGGTAAFQIEMGRWHGVKREERVCKECDSGEVEDVVHWLLQCSAWDHLRQPLLAAMDEVMEDFSVQNEKEKAALILSLACRNYRILSIINSMWSARFY